MREYDEQITREKKYDIYQLHKASMSISVSNYHLC
jgi:hypothetical protein